MFTVAVISALCAFALAPQVRDATRVLSATRLAMGAAAWPQAGALGMTGRKTKDGLVGGYRETDDLRTGGFRRDVAYAMFADAEGADAAGRWRLDGSGGVHALDSPEADAVAKTERYIARRGYLHDEPGVELRLLSSDRDGAYVDIEATPAGGRAATLRIRRANALVERITLALSPHPEAIRYSDFRRVGKTLLPFRIVTDYGDEAESGTVDVARYTISRRSVAANAFARSRSIDDVTFATGATTTTIPARIDAMSNFLIVDASLDGAPAAPFVLDTGGHDIVTPREARRLHLAVSGMGKSYGAGSGASTTRYTRVRSVVLGSARLGPQPFAVLDLDLGETPGADGHVVPIAGILGLEIFERFEVTIARTSVTFARDSRARACGAVPLRFTSDMPLATASLDGVAGTFGIDTGNNVDPIVFAHFLHAHALHVRQARARSIGGSSVGGTLSLTPGRIARIRLGETLLEDVPIDVSSMATGSLSTRSEAGNLGLSLLLRLGRVTFDYRHDRMCVGPNA